MKRSYQILLFVITFMVVGELMIRFDKSAKVLEEKRIVKISTDIERTVEYEMLERNLFNSNNTDLKIMVIGDSYIHGGGIEFDDNFSQTLKRMINAEKGSFKSGWVLDLSKSSSNNLDNNQTYFEFVGRFHPDIVIIGYNINDIEGNLQKSPNKKLNSEFEEKRAAGAEAKSLVRKISKIIYKSEFVHFVLHKTHNQLKAKGYIIPGSRADITINSYWQNKDNWKKSKSLLEEIIEHTIENRIQLIVFKFPEINLLEYPNLFIKSNETIRSFFNDFTSIYYIDGTELFMNKNSDEYRLSKYDGHPNEKAHEVMALETFNLIKESNAAYDTQKNNSKNVKGTNSDN